MELKTITEARLNNHLDSNLIHYLRVNQTTYEIRFGNRICLLDILDGEYIATYYSFDEIIKEYPDGRLAYNVPKNVSYLDAHYIPIKNMEVYTCDEWRKR